MACNCKIFYFSFIFLVGLPQGLAATAPVGETPASAKLTAHLESIRVRILKIEQELISDKQAQSNTVQKLGKIRELMGLQQQEKKLSEARFKELNQYIVSLTERKQTLQIRLLENQERVRSRLRDIHSIVQKEKAEMPSIESEKWLSPLRKILARLVSLGIQEIETVKVDLTDAEHLENQIEEEKQHLAYYFQELKEQESLMEFHRQLQETVLKKSYSERLARLEYYNGLKQSEKQVEKLIGQFNARLEFEKIEAEQREVTKSILMGDFAKMQGKLQAPVTGKIVSEYGQFVDPQSKLKVFKKGIEIATATDKGQPVSAIAAGRVVFAGSLPNYGLVTIVDHGANYYSLCAQLGRIDRKIGDRVGPREPLGVTDAKGTPLYFEIRSHNVPVNPLKWLASSINF